MSSGVNWLVIRLSDVYGLRDVPRLTSPAVRPWTTVRSADVCCVRCNVHSRFIGSVLLPNSIVDSSCGLDGFIDGYWLWFVVGGLFFYGLELDANVVLMRRGAGSRECV